MTEDQSRRAFLQRSGTLGIVGAASPFVMNLAAIGEAAASVNTDYKALVCIFLFGGNDWANTLPPYDQELIRHLLLVCRYGNIWHECAAIPSLARLPQIAWSATSPPC